MSHKVSPVDLSLRHRDPIHSLSDWASRCALRWKEEVLVACPEGRKKNPQREGYSRTALTGMISPTLTLSNNCV